MPEIPGTPCFFRKVQRFFAAEIRWLIAVFAHDKCGGRYIVGQPVGFVDAGIADDGEGHADRLSGIARIGERSDVADHCGGKDEFCGDVAVGAEGFTFEDFSVFEDKIFFHKKSMLREFGNIAE